MFTVIVTASVTVAVCALLAMAFWLGIRHERRRQQMLADWLAAQAEAIADAEGASAMPHLPTRDEIEKQFMRQSDAANLRPL
ncbi:MAG: hypothetical protein M0038_06695 [Pseudomonadota bacterium]|jgi:hypothetical protein|nr:hypothetical protein [Pseudomonadota bacterium]